MYAEASGSAIAQINVRSGTSGDVIELNPSRVNVDTIINGDTAAVITVDASADAATVNNLTITGTAGNVYSGTYTPTLTNVTNIAASGTSTFTILELIIW